MKAVIFDMDGVLIDSVALQVEAFAAYFARHGIAFGPDQLARFNGPSTREILETMKKEHGLGYEISQALLDVGDLAHAMLARAAPFPGARETVQRFRLRGYRVALASSAPAALIRQLCGDWHFDAVVSGEEIEQSKPAPEIFLRAAEALGVPPAQCAVVEDAPLGVRAAKTAGMLAVGITNTASGDDLGADIVIADIADTLTLPQLFAGEVLMTPPRPIRLDDVAVNLDRSASPVVPDRPEETATLDEHRYNGLVANLQSYDVSPERMTINANVTDYATYRRMRARPDYDIFAHGLCALGTSALLITSDDKAILARRGAGLSGEGMLYNIPGGVFNVDSSASVARSLFKELEEEVGLSTDHVVDCAFIGMGHDLLGKGAELLFALKVNVAAPEVIALQRGASHAHEATQLRAVPLARLPDYLEDEEVMPSTRALIRCYLELGGALE